jgi:WD40 repeat protein
MSLAVPTEAPVGARYSPYQGLVPYSEFDAEWFFGRDEWSAVVADNLRAYRITVLYGPSGVGKSSLLHAGTIRTLNDEARENVVDHGVPRLLPVAFSAWSLDDPLSALKDALSAAGEPLAGSLVDAFDELPRRVGGPVLLVLDQLEELFVYHDRAGDTTIEKLAVLLRRRDPAVHFLLSIREDALADLDRFEGQVSGLGDHLLRLEHLDREAGREAITAPLELWNRTVAAKPVEIEDALVETVLDQVTTGRVSLGDDDVAISDGNRAAGIEAPYLQLVLVHLWDEERKQGSDILRLETLERLGGADRIVRTHLDESLGSLPVAEQDVAGRTLRYLVTPSGTKIALRMSDLADYAEVPADRLEPLVERLAGPARVLRPAGDGRYEIYHDALAGPILDWQQRWDVRTRRRRERRRLLILTAIIIALVAIIAGISVLAIWALHQRHSADRAAVRATSFALAGVANTYLSQRTDVSFLVAREGYELGESAAARSSLVWALEFAKDNGAIAVLRGHSAPVYGVAFSSDGRTVASGDSDGTIRLWDAGNHRQIGHALFGHTGVVYSVGFSPDGKTLVSAGADGTVRLWNVRMQRQMGQALLDRKTATYRIAFSPNGRTIATSGGDRTVWLWDIRTRERRGPLRVDGNGAALAFSPDGRLATADATKIVLWDVGAQPPRGHLFSTNGSAVWALAFSKDGRTLATAGTDGTVQLWDVQSPGKRGRPLPGDHGTVYDIAFGRNETLATAGADGTVRLWDAATRQQRGRPLNGHVGAVLSIAFAANGRLVASAGRDTTVRLWDARRSREPSRRIATGLPTADDVAFSPDGRTLAAATAAGAWLWDRRSGRPEGAPLGGGSRSVAFSPNGRMLATGDAGGVQLWNVRTHRVVDKRLGAEAEDVAFSPDGRTIASGGWDGALRLWDLGSKKSRVILGAHKDGITAVAFNADGSMLASAGRDSTVRLWDVNSRKQIGAPILVHTAHVNDVAFSQDGRILASASAQGDSAVRLWDVRSHAQLDPPLRGNKGGVYQLAFSPDGRTLATAGADATVRLWDVDSHQHLGGPLIGHLSDVYAVAFSPDGRALASVGKDGTMRLWEGFLFPPDDLGFVRDRACGFAGGNLTRDQWDEFAPGIPYRGTCP